MDETWRPMKLNECPSEHSSYGLGTVPAYEKRNQATSAVTVGVCSTSMREEIRR